MSQTVYVYATGREPDLRAVSALVSLGIQPTLLTVGLKETDRRRWEYQVQRYLPEVTVLHSEGSGLAFGYNTALAACKTEYIVYLSQDSVPTSQWWESLINEWRRASENVAAIGGPITLPQLSQNLQSIYGGYEHGKQPRFLSAQKQTLLGNNISFRVCALKAVQAFWPAKGIPGGPNWFSEEHHLQRELAQLGWQLYYSPDLRIERYPKQSGWLAHNLMAARFHYGTRLAAIGQGQASQKSAQFFAKACVGTATAVLKRDRELFATRACRASENLGALLGRNIAQKGLQPIGTTPFRASVPKPQHTALKQKFSHITCLQRQTIHQPPILLYHRVTELKNDPLKLAITPKQFEQELKTIKQQYTPFSMSELMKKHRERTLPENAVAITFDDGYIDNLEYAAPLLDDAQIPATFFVSTAHIRNQKGFFWDDVSHILLDSSEDQPPILTLTIGSHRCCWPTTTREERVHVRKYLHAWMQPQPHEEIEKVLTQLYRWADRPRTPFITKADRPMSVEELQILAAYDGVEVGAHSHHHVSLANQDKTVQRGEIQQSKTLLKDWLKESPLASFSYPFGVPGDNFNLTTMQLVNDSGFAFAVSNSEQQMTGKPDSLDNFQLPRFSSLSTLTNHFKS